MTPPRDPDLDRLTDAILAHVPFDGWSPTAFRRAVADSGLLPARARSLAPRGAIDLAAAEHRRGDDRMAERMRSADLSGIRYREKVAFAVRARLDAVSDREAARRASALFALPLHAAEGARLIWGTADAIWEALGDNSDDVNWYTKRAILSGVYTSCLLFWLGDDSTGGQATEAFVDRRIEDVMRIETAKAKVNESPLFRPLTAPLNHLLSFVKAPPRMPQSDLPAAWAAPPSPEH